MNLSSYIDHTVLKATTTRKDVMQLCKEAKEHDFFAVCINGSYITLAKEQLEGSNVKVASVIGFPLGAMDTISKVFEARQAVKYGADEIDMVINVGALKSGDYNLVADEIIAIKNAIGDVTLKVIIETCYLTKEEIVVTCQFALKAGAEFVKTSTGFGTGGATLEDVRLMKEVVGNNALIKASGGVKTKEDALQFIEAGANRIGTSSGIQIVTGS